MTHCFGTIAQWKIVMLKTVKVLIIWTHTHPGKLSSSHINIIRTKNCEGRWTPKIMGSKSEPFETTDPIGHVVYPTVLRVPFGTSTKPFNDCRGLLMRRSYPTTPNLGFGGMDMEVWAMENWGQNEVPWRMNVGSKWFFMAVWPNQLGALYDKWTWPCSFDRSTWEFNQRRVHSPNRGFNQSSGWTNPAKFTQQLLLCNYKYGGHPKRHWGIWTAEKEVMMFFISAQFCCFWKVFYHPGCDEYLFTAASCLLLFNDLCTNHPAPVAQ